MKRIFIFSLYCIMITTYAVSQNCDIPLMVMVDNADGSLSEQNVHQLNAKLSQAVCIEGISSSKLAHLCMIATVSESQREIISGTRPLITNSIDVYLTIANLISGEKFGVTNITLNGSGNTEFRAFQSAFAQINPRNPSFNRFIKESRQKILDYYSRAILSIISRANTYATEDNFEDALYLLSTVPPCTNGYEAIEDAFINVWQKMIDVDCASKLQKAWAVWRSSKTEEAAKIAAAYIASIDFRSSCRDSAADLLTEISDKIDDDMRRALEREQRLLNHEDEDRTFEKDMAKAQLDLRRMQIESAREIGLAYAQNVLTPILGGNDGNESGSQQSDNSKSKPDTNPIHIQINR